MVDSVDDERISQATREEVLERDRYLCQTCGRLGADAGGIYSLQVHHMKKIPSDRDRNDIENLITLCVPCHNWIHNLPDRKEIPIEVSDEAATKLLGQDYEIIQILYEDGPLSVREIKQRLKSDHSVQALRDRLWLIMGLDVAVESQDIQLIDHDANEGIWGIPAEISNSERGRIPEEIQTFGKRIEDELVRQALARGIDRKTVAKVFDITSRATRYKERRAYAYNFPLDVIDTRGRPPETTDEISDDEEDQSPLLQSNAEQPDEDQTDATAEIGMQPSVDSEVNPSAPIEADEEPTDRDSEGDEEVQSEDLVKTIDEVDFETDRESRYLLLSLDLSDDQRDALRAKCASKQQSVHSFIERQVETLATELVDG